MTPKEKAKQIHSLFMKPIDDAKKYALISVDEILESVGLVNYGKYESKIDFAEFFKYWKQVKEEIEKL